MLLDWNWRITLLLVLAIVTIAGYAGALSAVQHGLEAVANAGPVAQAASQPSVAKSFSGPDGRADAYFVMFLFVFASPLAFTMVAVLLVIALTAAASFIAPLVGGQQKIALVVVALAVALLVYVERGEWLPRAMYVLGLLARAYIVVTA